MSAKVEPWLQQEIERFLAERFANPGPRTVPLKQAVSVVTGIPEEAIGEVRPAGKDEDGRQVYAAEVKIEEPFVYIDSGLWQIG